MLPAIPMVIAPVPTQGGGLGTVVHPADVQRAVLAPGGPLVPPLEAPLRPALVVQAVPPSRHVQLAVPTHGLHAGMLAAVVPVAQGPLALARRLLAVVQATPLDRHARVPRVTPPRAPLPGTAPVVVAAAARVAHLAPARDLGSARLRLARVRLAEQGPVVDQPGLLARAVRCCEAAVPRAVPLAAFALDLFAVRVSAAVWCSDEAVSHGSSMPARRRRRRWSGADLRSSQYLNLSGLPSLTLLVQLNPSRLTAWHWRSRLR